MDNPTVNLHSLQQRHVCHADRYRYRLVVVATALGLVLVLAMGLAPLLYGGGVDLPPSPLEEGGEGHAGTVESQQREERERIAISPACNAGQERWYIEVRYRYRDPALDIWRLRFSLAAEAGGVGETEGAGWRRDFNTVIRRGGGQSLPIYHSLLPSMPSELIVDNNERRVAITTVSCRPYEPFPSTSNSAIIHPIDVATLTARNDFAHPVNKDGNNLGFFLYRWNHFPSMLIADTADYQTLGRLFNRLAFFIEKKGSAGTLYSDAELGGRFAWNGHNYNAADLARFYSAAEAEARQVTLNAEELQLRDILIAHGVIVNAPRPLRTADDRYAAGVGGVVAISQQSNAYARRLLLQHELLHAVFYASDGYRAAVERVWLALSDEERRGWRALLGYLTYDPENEYVVMNEFHAYLLAKPVAESIAQLTAIAGAAARAAPQGEAATDERDGVGLAALVAGDSRSMRQSAAQLTLLLGAYSGLAPGSLRNVEGGVPVTR